MSKKCEHIKDISDKTLDELLTFKDAILFLIDYYSNVANANRGAYDSEFAQLYKDSSNMVKNYSDIYNKIVKDIEQKINKELLV